MSAEGPSVITVPSLNTMPAEESEPEMMRSEMNSFVPAPASVDWVHANSDAKFAMQIGHAGAKGSTRLAWEGIDQPLVEDNWPLISASPQQYLKGVSQTAREMTRADMDQVTAAFVASTQSAAAIGVDWLELHCAHGYLLSSFISPLTNQRSDAYGGSLDKRLRYPLEVFAAVRAAWPDDRPMSVRISATDWVEGGIES